MKIEFDPFKDLRNIENHGLSLAKGELIFQDENHPVIPSIRLIDGEERFKIIGLIRRRLHIAVFVWRGDAIRFISVRKSNSSEERIYYSS